MQLTSSTWGRPYPSSRGGPSPLSPSQRFHVSHTCVTMWPPCNLSLIVLAFSVFYDGLAASYGIELLRTLYSAGLTTSLVYAWHVCSILVHLGISEFIYPPNEMLWKLSTSKQN